MRKTKRKEGEVKEYRAKSRREGGVERLKERKLEKYKEGGKGRKTRKKEGEGKISRREWGRENRLKKRGVEKYKEGRKGRNTKRKKGEVEEYKKNQSLSGKR